MALWNGISQRQHVRRAYNYCALSKSKHNVTSTRLDESRYYSSHVSLLRCEVSKSDDRNVNNANVFDPRPRVTASVRAYVFGSHDGQRIAG